MTTEPPACVLRDMGLGAMAKLEDEQLLNEVFYLLDCADLVRVQRTSPALYVMLNDERLWKDVFLREVKGTKTQVVFCTTWKVTAMLYLFGRGRAIDTIPGVGKMLHFPGFQSMEIYTRWLRRHTIVTQYGEDLGHVDRVRSDEMDVATFIERYEIPSIPVLLTHGQEDWPAMKEWSRERLVERFGHVSFKISHQGHKRIPMKFADYADYMRVQTDEEPLYVFDEAFGEKAPEMLAEYSVPKFFPEDLFSVSGKDRPHFRWLVAGPPRSGAPWHIDPAGTSAWNSLISGKKRWLMYPPLSDPVGVHLEDISEKFYGSPPSLLWLLEVYPYLPPDQKPIECIQLPGETIFIPGGWWHMVLNMEESIAVTQNFCDSQNFRNVCQELHDDGKEYNNFKSLLLANKPEFADKFEEFELMESQVRHGFNNMEHWGPLVKNVFGRHFPDMSLDDKDFVVSPPISGQSPVFIVNSQYVIKFYCTEFGGEDSYRHESHLYEVAHSNDFLASVFPVLLAKGNLLDETHSFPACPEIRWKWPYIVTSFVKGVNLQEIQIVPEEMSYPYQPDLPVEVDSDDEDQEPPPKINNTKLIELITRVTTTLHSIEPRLDNPFITDASNPWTHWHKRLEELLAKYAGNQWGWNGMPLQLRSSMRSYLPADYLTIVDRRLPPCYLHTDITDENILGEITTTVAPPVHKKKAGIKISALAKAAKKLHIQAPSRKSPHSAGIWTPKHMIDFGDSNFGDRWYELVSLHLSVLAVDKQRFRIFLQHYTFSERDGPEMAGKSWLDYYNENPSQFIYRAMCYTLIHHCDALTTVTRHYPAYRNAKTIEELAKLIWDIDYNPIN
eukprot:gene8167-9601_t